VPIWTALREFIDHTLCLPAALTFIDKYTQVPRILAPIVQCIESLPQLVDDPAFHSYVSQEWGSIDGLRLQILSDFFKHGFDGSGERCLCVGAL
jgi:hypothetical protein